LYNKSAKVAQQIEVDLMGFGLCSDHMRTLSIVHFDTVLMELL